MRRLPSSSGLRGGLGRAEVAGGGGHGLDDVQVAGAPADVPTQSFGDLTFGHGAAAPGDQRVRREHHARGAVPALAGITLQERDLDGAQLLWAAKSLDGGDL